MDLTNISKTKSSLLQSIHSHIPDNLKIISGNALRKSDFDNCSNYFNSNEPITVINEGLLRYLTFEEKKQVAENIHNIISQCNGFWITSDVTPKKFIQSQNKSLLNFNKDLNTITSRNNLKDKFEDINHIQTFFGDIGLELIEVHKFNEVKNDLYSVSALNIIDDKINQTLEGAIVVIMKAKNKSHST